MGVFDNLKKMFGTKEQTLSESFDAAVQAEYQRMEKIREKRGTRQNHVNECISVMKDCRTKFTQVIAEERKIAMKKSYNGIPDSRERTRIREAAIGILTVDMALFDLESISSEAELNAAMNQMGKALWQMIRLDQTNGGISASSRSFIDLFYPSFKCDVALLRGTIADENGNISFAHESVINEGFAVANAVKNCGWG